MQKLILHIGPPKTGTTSLQRFLSLIHDKLLSHGVLYPKEGRLRAESVYQVRRRHGTVTLRGPADSHQLLVWALKREVAGVDADECWSDVLQEIQRIGPHTIILSAEDFFGLSEPQVLEVRKKLVDFTVEVVLYLREPFEMCLSGYKQHVKMGRYHRSFSRFLDEEGPSIFQAYDTRTKRWSKIFGSEFIVYKPYDKLTKGSGLAKDLLCMLGLNPEDFESFLTQGKRLNISPPDTGIQVIRSLNLVEYCLGSPEWLKVVFRYARAKLSRRNALTNILFTVGSPIWGKPLFHNEEEIIMRNKVLEEFPCSLMKFLESVAQPHKEILSDAKPFVEKGTT